MARIAFIHPDLGIGGAERLVVDAAAGLQLAGNSVHIYTSHCDKTHCFEEVSSGELEVSVYGDFMPTQIFGKLHIVFASLRQLYLVLLLILSGQIDNYDYFIVDQLSICIPFLQLFTKESTKILFYCHFPDQLLSKRGSLLKLLYRIPFNRLEEWTTGLSDQIVVNLNFTRGIFHDTFTNLTTIEPAVIYPCVDIEEKDDSDLQNAVQEVSEAFEDTDFFLSVNRFEITKNIDLAIEAFHDFKSKTSPSRKIRLVVAGGYDSRVSENVLYLRHLEDLCAKLELKCFTIRGKLVVIPPSTDVLFLPSVKSSIKTALIRQSALLLYTPSFEHFGIVPVEGMLNRTVVLAVNRGGPLESVVDYKKDPRNATGYLCEPQVATWSKTMVEYYQLSDAEKRRLGENGHKRVQKLFLREEMTASFEKHLKATKKADLGFLFTLILYWKVIVALLVLLLAAAFTQRKL